MHFFFIYLFIITSLKKTVDVCTPGGPAQAELDQRGNDRGAAQWQQSSDTVWHQTKNPFFHLHLNSERRSSLTTSQIRFSSISSSSFFLSRTAKGKTSSAHAGSVCSRWDYLKLVCWCRKCFQQKKKNLFPRSPRACSVISTTPLFLCCNRTWSAWWPTRTRASNAVYQRSSLGWLEGASIGATSRHVWTYQTVMKSNLEWYNLCVFPDFFFFTARINHFPHCFLQVEGLWQLLCPLLRTALSNITIETYADWGTCIATACVSLLASFPHFTSSTPNAHRRFCIALCRSGEPRPTEAALAVWDADGVSCQWRGGLFCWCLVSKIKTKGSCYEQVLIGAAHRDSWACCFFHLQPPLCAAGRSSSAGVACSRAPSQVVAISRAQTHTGLQKCSRTNRQVRLFSHVGMCLWR